MTSTTSKPKGMTSLTMLRMIEDQLQNAANNINRAGRLLELLGKPKGHWEYSRMLHGATLAFKSRVNSSLTRPACRRKFKAGKGEVAP